MDTDTKLNVIITLLVIIIILQTIFTFFLVKQVNHIDEAALLILQHQERLRREFEEKCK